MSCRVNGGICLCATVQAIMLSGHLSRDSAHCVLAKAQKDCFIELANSYKCDLIT